MNLSFQQIWSTHMHSVRTLSGCQRYTKSINPASVCFLRKSPASSIVRTPVTLVVSIFLTREESLGLTVWFHYAGVAGIRKFCGAFLFLGKTAF